MGVSIVKTVKALLPILCIILFESITDYRMYVPLRRLFMMVFIREGYLIIMVLFYILLSKSSVLRNVFLGILLLILLPSYVFLLYLYLPIPSLAGGIPYTIFELLTFIQRIDQSIFMYVFLISISILGLKKRSIYSIILPIIGLGIFYYQLNYYHYPLMNDVYEEIGFSIRNSQFTSLRFALTYATLLLSPIFLGFLSLVLEQKTE